MLKTRLLPTESQTSFRFKRLTGNTAPYLVIVVIALVAIFTFSRPGFRFVSAFNLQSIAVNSAGLIVMGVGMTLILGAGHIDISIGANLVMASVVGGKTIVALQDKVGPGTAITIGFIVCLLTGGVGGLINGLVVTRLKITSFIATLGTMGVFTGAANILAGGADVSGLTPQLQANIGLQSIAYIPVPILMALVVVLIGWWLLNVTSFGRHSLAIGSDSRAAARSGVNLRATSMGIFIVSGLCAGIAGFFDLAQFGTTALDGHAVTPLTVIAAVIIGGTSLFGGRASMWGTAFATFIPTVLLAGLVYIGLQSFYQNIAIGAVLILAVFLDGVRRTQRDD